jgi:DNA-binding MarR family transcriptional regulator
MMKIDNEGTGDDVSKTPELPTLPCTCARLRKAGRLVTQVYDRALQPLGVKLTQYSVLINIARAEGQTITALACRLAMDRTTLSRNLRPLERLGLVKVEPGGDGRSRSVETTEEGRQILEKAIPRWREAEERIRKGLGQSDATELHRLLDRIGREDLGVSA